MNKNGYLKRFSEIFQRFQAKQKRKKNRSKNLSDHGYFAKEKSNYRNNRDQEILALRDHLMFNGKLRHLSLMEISDRLFGKNNNPFWTESATRTYIKSAIKRAKSKNRQAAYGAKK